MTAKELQQWREQHGLLQGELAELLGVHLQTVSKWEREIQQIPPYLHLALKTLSLSLKRKTK